jgi:DNA-binding winged helix-turn-helix (wHTH) protein
MNKPDRHLYEFGPFCLDLTERLLVRENERVRLTPLVFETLVVLVQRRGHLVE